MLHIQRGDVESFSLPDDLKQAFLETLNVKNEVLRAIPQDRSRLDDDKAIDRLDSKAGSTVFAIKGLARQMSEAGMSIDSKTKSHIGELGKHGFVPGPHIPQEANDWVWNSHEVISKLFDIAEGKQDDD